MKAGYIEHKQTRRNGRALSGANSDGAENLRCTLEYESALAFGEERLDSGNQVSGDTFSGEDHSPLVRADVVKSLFDIQEVFRGFWRQFGGGQSCQRKQVYGIQVCLVYPGQCRWPSSWLGGGNRR